MARLWQCTTPTGFDLRDGTRTTLEAGTIIIQGSLTPEQRATFLDDHGDFRHHHTLREGELLSGQVAAAIKGGILVEMGGSEYE